MNKISSLPNFAPPVFVGAARKEFDALRVANPNLRYVDAVLADVIGVLRGKRLPIGEAARLFECGMQIPHSIYLMDAYGEMTNPLGRGFGDGDPDGTAWPIPGTMSPVWDDGAPRAQMLMTLRDDQGVADPAEPRATLERVLEHFSALKLTPVCALELEFYLIDRQRDPNGSPQPPLDPRSGRREKVASVYGIDDLDRYESFLTALTAAAAAQRVPVSAASKEYAPGQFEVNLKHQVDARMAADHAVFLKQIVKAAARKAGFDATFMAKPYAERAGSGLHIHTSLLGGNGRGHGAVRAQPQFLSPFRARHVRAGQSPLGRQQPFRRIAHSGRPRRGAPRRTPCGGRRRQSLYCAGGSSSRCASRFDGETRSRRACVGQCLARAGYRAAVLPVRSRAWHPAPRVAYP